LSAIVDAFSVYGIRNITMPATPHGIWKRSRMRAGIVILVGWAIRAFTPVFNGLWARLRAVPTEGCKYLS
jgi:hypothetical protein